MDKKIQGYVKLQIPAGKANPSPPVGPALGQAGVNIMEFCTQFNAFTQKDEPGQPTPVVITVFTDKSFTFLTKKPPVSYFVKKAAKLEKGSGSTGKTANVGKITKKQAEEIAQAKMNDLNANDLAAATSMVIGTAKSMGIEVVEAA
jgi:large subunit ribosomal protein L11